MITGQRFPHSFLNANTSSGLEILLWIRIVPYLDQKGRFLASYYYIHHRASGGSLRGGRIWASRGTPPEGAILAHEWGHAYAYWDVARPAILESLEPYCDGRDLEPLAVEIKQNYERALRTPENAAASAAGANSQTVGWFDTTPGYLTMGEKFGLQTWLKWSPW